MPGLLAGGTGPGGSTWPSGHYIPQSRNGFPPPSLLTSPNSWLKTHNGRPALAPEAEGHRAPRLPVGLQFGRLGNWIMAFI